LKVFRIFSTLWRHINITRMATATTRPTSLEILQRFYGAESIYMSASPSERDFSGMAATLSPDIVLYQSPDLPYGGTYKGHDEFRKWADAMAERFDVVRPEGGKIYQQVVLDQSQQDDSIEEMALSATVPMRIRKTGKDWSQFGVQIVKVDREREVITELRVMYWDVAGLRQALGE
jgi:uncharacterized protein